MKHKEVSVAFTCVGAMVGAGFASGKEVAAFFSRYGSLSYLLIVLSVIIMMRMMALVRRKADERNIAYWMDLFQDQKWFVRLLSWMTVGGLTLISGGAMTAAAGHLCALIFPWNGVQWAGMLIGLTTAHAMCDRHMKGLSQCSTILCLLFLLSCLMSIFFGKTMQTVQLNEKQTMLNISLGAFKAASYSAMNVTLALAVIIIEPRQRTSVTLYTGAVIGALLLIANSLYLKNPALLQTELPMIAALSVFGRGGFLLAVWLMLLAVLTSLSAALTALRQMLPQKKEHMRFMMPIADFLLLCIAKQGFGHIIERWYAPIGAACILFVFLPLTAAGWKRHDLTT